MAEAANSAIPENVKKLVRAVLLSKIGGVPVQRFPSDYKALIGENFPMISLGFNSLILCMKSMPDVVRIVGDNPDTCVLLGIGDDTSFMSGPAIQAQFPVEGRQKRQRGRKQNGTSRKENGKINQSQSVENGSVSLSEKFPDLVPNMQGLYSVVVKGIHNAYTANEVYRLFLSEAAVVSHSQFNTFYFFRFGNMRDAERILSKYDGFMINGTRIGISPAQEKGTKHSDKSSDGGASKSSSSNNSNDKSQPGRKTLQPESKTTLSKVNEEKMMEKRENTRTCKEQNGTDTKTSNKQQQKTSGKVNEETMINKKEKTKTYKAKIVTDTKTSNKQQQKTTRTTEGRINGSENPLFENDKQLHAQLQSIDHSSLPNLQHYIIHVENIKKNTSEDELMKLFENFKPLWCRVGKASSKWRHIYAEVAFTNWEDIKAISKQFRVKHFKGEKIVIKLAFKTVRELVLKSETIGMKTPNSVSAATPNATPSSTRSTNKECEEDWDLTGDSPLVESTGSRPTPVYCSSSQPTPVYCSSSQPTPVYCSSSQPTPVYCSSRQPTPVYCSSRQPTPVLETSCQSSTNHQELSMETMLETLPEPVSQGASHASDSEGSATSARRRRPCILDFIQD